MRTNNYLGKHDENRGIIIFFILLCILAIVVGGIILSKKLNNKDDIISKSDDIAHLIEKKVAEINKFEYKDDELILNGVLNGGISNNIITKLKSIDIVLRDKNGDIYEYQTDYFISQEKIEFSTILEDKENSTIELNDINPGEYFVLLRLKYEVQNNKEGYNYKYYTLKNNTENNKIEQDNIITMFDSAKKVTSYLTLTKLANN